ncbi:REP-associated tyrosine transposase [Rubeoparvulum massiliense]|uniref:REP-associated tyrosine transposase n=1 Tax=Rubeoparvulum massiliense TaxID=1631346 RepID=UPI00065E8099|nr:transposase [Rubeoparvulum massiliense]
MARKPRIWFPGAIYHITARGNRRSSLFHDQRDYRKYFALLKETRTEFPFILHAYCLMPNHIHLLLETLETPPGLIMKKWHASYALAFNKRHDLVGHLFQGRYGAKLVKNDEYFLTVSRYIHRNPLEAQMVKKAEEYPWSSYAAYFFGRKNPYITTTKTFSYFSEPQREQYRKFIEEGGQSPSDLTL